LTANLILGTSAIIANPLGTELTRIRSGKSGLAQGLGSRLRSSPSGWAGSLEHSERENTTIRTTFDRDVEVSPQSLSITGYGSRDPGGAICGIILWESKRTKEWSRAWLSTVRENQRIALASLSVIASTALPPGLKHFDCIDDVWVSSFACIIPLAKALRATLIRANLVQVSGQDRIGKTERVHSYVTGQEFKHRVSSIVEAYIALQKELEKEKRVANASWARRAKYHDQIMIGVEGMGGELQGIVGESMPEIESLEGVELDCEPISLPTAELTPQQPKELAAGLTCPESRRNSNHPSVGVRSERK
jgi:hypothetical protein